jgi:hypothetical protein
VNRGTINTETTMIQNRYDIMAVSLATSIIEDATQLAFDSKTDGAAITATTSLTSASSLGIETGESKTYPAGFDDFDDYNCYKTTPKVDEIGYTGSTRKVIFHSLVRIDYVNGNNPGGAVSSTQTYHKRMQVRVYSPGLQDTIRMSTVYSYWYFR